MVSRGQTLGDRATSIRILDSEGNAPGLERSVKRYMLPLAVSIGSTLITFVFGSSYTYTNYSYNYNYNTTATAGFLILAVYAFLIVGYLWMLWDPNRQTLFDKIAGTYVVKTL
jgi:uncharacterized RDD family membrane protein YckC